jgi:large conductance mechanosensitive channel
VNSLVSDVLMPPLGQLLGHMDFSQFVLHLGEKTTLNYGVFLNTIINFVIVAFAVFLLVRGVNKWVAKPAPAEAPTTKECPQCAMTIPIAAKRCGHCTSQL